MPYALIDYSNYRASVRSACANSDASEIPDAILTPGTSIHADLVEAYINEQVPDYDTSSATKKLLVQIAGIKLLAAKLCRTHCKGIYKTASDDQHSYQKNVIDWDALAGILEGEAEEILEPGVLLALASNAYTIPMSWDPVTGLPQYIKTYRNGTGVDL